MKPEDFDNSASCAMHENCKKCLLKDSCNVWKHYKALKENACTHACDLICFMQHLDFEAMTIYKYLTAGNKAFIERRVKIYCMYYYKKFGKLWERYEVYDKNNLTKDQKTEIIVYTCRILERYGVLEYFEAKLGINLSREYDDYIRHIIKMERAQNARIAQRIQSWGVHGFSFDTADKIGFCFNKMHGENRYQENKKPQAKKTKRHVMRTKYPLLITK